MADSEHAPIAEKQIPRQTLLAIQKLNDQIETLTQHLTSQTSVTSQGRIQAQLDAISARQANMRPASNMPPTPLEGIRQAGESLGVGSGNAGQIYEAAQGLGGPAQAQQARERLAASGAPPASAFPPNAIPSGGGRGIIKKIAGPMSPSTMEEIEHAEFKIPQFGEWQLDTKLEMARDWAGKLAAKQGRYGPEGQYEGNITGQIANQFSKVANFGYEHAAQIEVARRIARAGIDRAQGYSMAGGSLGFNPENGYGPQAILGFRNPLAYLTSEAGREGLGMKWDEFKMRMGMGLTGGQASEVYNSLAAMGFSNNQHGMMGLIDGGDLQNVASKLVWPLVREGMSPQTAAEFANTLRNGNVSMDELRKTVKGLGDDARSSRETLDQYAQSLQSFAEGAEGVTKGQALQIGKSFTNITGMDPRFLQQMQQSPIFQGLAMGQLGVLPSAVQQLNAGSQMHLTMQAMNMAMRATGGLATNKYETINGKRVLVASGEEAQMAQAAQLLGIPFEEFKRLHAHTKEIEESGRAETLLNSPLGFKAEAASIDYKKKLLSKASGPRKKQLESEIKASEGRIEHGGGNTIGWNDLRSQLEKVPGISHKEIEKLSHQKNFTKRGEEVEKLLAQHGEQKLKSEGNNVQVQFTGFARKFFEQVPNSYSSAKSTANSGGNPISNFMNGVRDVANEIPGVGPGVDIAEKVIESL